MNRLPVSGGMALSFVIALSNARAQMSCQVTYDAAMSTLPQSQGWTLFQSNYAGPPPVVNNTSLHQGPTNYAGYQYWSRTDFSSPVGNAMVLEFELQAINVDTDSGSGVAGWAAYLSDDVGRLYILGVSSGKLEIIRDYDWRGPSIAFDAAAKFHKYVFVADATGARLIVDGFALLTISPATTAGCYTPHIVLFGDGTASSGGETRLRFLRAGPIGIAAQPVSLSTCRVGNASVSVTAAGTSPFTYQWQYEAMFETWVDATNGPIPYGGGTITASNVQSDHLRLALNTTRGAPPIRFRCVVTNSCGSVASDPATLAPCQADFTCDGQVDDADFVGFAASYNILDCAGSAMPATCPADLNGDGFVDDSDFVQFVAAYNNLGCL